MHYLPGHTIPTVDALSIKRKYIIISGYQIVIRRRYDGSFGSFYQLLGLELLCLLRLMVLPLPYDMLLLGELLGRGLLLKSPMNHIGIVASQAVNFSQIPADSAVSLRSSPVLELLRLLE